MHHDPRCCTALVLVYHRRYTVLDIAVIAVVERMHALFGNKETERMYGPCSAMCSTVTGTVKGTRYHQHAVVLPRVPDR
jgi:hypothetical protein